MTILISFIISIAVAASPVVLGVLKIPGRMVLAQNKSLVISAACHCYPPRGGGSSQNGDVSAAEALVEMAMGKLKWGEVIDPLSTTHMDIRNSQDRLGHLAFGSPVQEVGEVVSGKSYRGSVYVR